MGIFLCEKQGPLLKALIEDDLKSLRDIPGISTHRARTFSFQKYRLKNRQVLGLPGIGEMKDALRRRGGEGTERPTRKQTDWMETGKGPATQEAEERNYQRDVETAM